MKVNGFKLSFRWRFFLWKIKGKIGKIIILLFMPKITMEIYYIIDLAIQV